MDENADELFELGKNYNLARPQSFEPAVARNYFELAAKLDHPDAIRAWALMLHQGTGGPKDFVMAIRALARGYFVLRDTESLDCLIDTLHDEIETVQKIRNGIDLQQLADKLQTLQKLSDEVNDDLRNLIRGENQTN